MGEIETNEKEQYSVDTLLQLLAIFINRSGGEVIITRQEFDMVEGVEVFGRSLTPDILRLRVYGSGEGCDCEDVT
jgi:hypothetical protein